MADPIDVLRARLTAPGPHNPDDLAAIHAVLDLLGDGTVEWGVRYESLVGSRWLSVSVAKSSEDSARMRASHLNNYPHYRNVEVVTRRRYVTDWQPVEPQP